MTQLAQGTYPLLAALFLWLNGWLHHIWQGFPKNVKGRGNPPSWGMGNFAAEEFFYLVVGIWYGMILTIWTFLNAKNNILKSKLAWLVSTEYEVKIKIVQPGLILEIEGSVYQRCKRALFPYTKYKRAALI